MLKHWKHEKGSAATYQALCEALQHTFVQRKDLAEKFCYINAPADQVPEVTVTGVVSGAAASTCDSGHSAGVRSARKQESVERAPANPVPKGTVTGQVSGAAATTRDSGHSTGVRSAWKRETVERGVLSWKVHCVSATSRYSGKHDSQERSEIVNKYMAHKIDEVNMKRTFDLSSFEGLENFHAYLCGHLMLVDTRIQKSSIKITVKCRTLEILERLWDDYYSGRLNAEAEKCLITENLKEELGMETIKLTTTILEEDYLSCKSSLMETAAPADQVPEGTVTGEVSGAAASTCDSGHSTGVRSARKQESVGQAPADQVPEGTVTGEVSGAAASTFDSGHSAGVRSGRKQESIERAPADPVQEGTVTGEVSGAAASTHDNGHSTGVRSIWKRESVEQDTDAFRKGKPSDLELDDLALKIGAKWKRLGIRLGISHDVLDGIAANAEDKPFQILLYWKNTTSSTTPYHDLYNALCHSRVGLNNLAKEFCFIPRPAGMIGSPCSSNHPAAKRTRLAEPFNLEKCQQQLQSIYNTMSKVKIIPWDESSSIHIDEIYTSLSWVRDDRKASGVKEKELKDYTDIFKGDKHHPNPKRLLVYGRPGIGKSTFSKKSAFDWAKQRKEILKKFYVVLLIKLRDVCDLQDIRDVLRASKLLAGGEVVSVDDVYEYILHNQEKVLLILDGYDEYFCTGESPVLEIWKGARLTDVHVIITTRQEKTDELRLPSNVQFEINGFKSDKQVRAFVSKVLGDEEKVEEFVSYLDQRDLKDLAEIPLLLLMLCTIWNEKKIEELPKSRAHICQNFVLTLIHHAITKDAKAEEEEDINALELYNVELCTLGKLAFDALLQNALSFPFGKLTDSIHSLSDKFIKFGLFHVLHVATFLRREKRVYFIHKSVQEYLAAFFVKEELLKEESTSCLSEIDSFEKIVKMIEVLRFACELSADAACAVLSHLGIVGKREGLTEYNFTETPCIHDLPDNQQQFLTLISHSFFSCAAEKWRDLYPVFLSFNGGVLFLDSDQLHSLANEHFLKSAAAPKFIFFRSGLHRKESYQDLISVLLEDLSAVVVCRSGKKWKASDFVKKYSLSAVNVFLKKEEEKIYLYISFIDSIICTFPTQMITELISSPESTQSNEQGDSSALCLTENSTDDTQATHHCLSFVREIEVDMRVHERQTIEILIEVLPLVTSLKGIAIFGGRSATDPVLVDTLVSRINFTNRLCALQLVDINLTAKHAAVIARSLGKAPNLRELDLSQNPLGEGVSDLTRHLSCAPDLETLYLDRVKMRKEQVSDLTEAVRQTKIRFLKSRYHDEEGNLKPEHKWPSDDYWTLSKSEDEVESETSSESEDEQGPGTSKESRRARAWDIK